MNEAQKIVLGIQNAATRRAKADESRRKATDDLRRCIIAAREAKIPVTAIAEVAGLSRQGVYDLISAQPSR